jgi:hypothetical protein
MVYGLSRLSRSSSGANGMKQVGKNRYNGQFPTLMSKDLYKKFYKV